MGPAASLEEELHLQLDYSPALSTLQELLCLAMAIAIGMLVHALVLVPRYGPGWATAAGAVVAAMLLGWVARNALLEQMYKVCVPCR